MTLYNDPPTVATGDPWSASNNNSFLRDNFRSGVPAIFSAAGQLAYSTAALVAAALNKPSASGSFVLTNDNTGALAWLAKNLIGGIHANGYISFTPNADYNGALANVAGASFTLNLTASCLVVAICALTGYQQYDGYGKATVTSLLIDGTPSSGLPYNGSTPATAHRNEDLMILSVKSGVSSGTKTIQLQAGGDGGSATRITQGEILALAFAQ